METRRLWTKIYFLGFMVGNNITSLIVALPTTLPREALLAEADADRIVDDFTQVTDADLA